MNLGNSAVQSSLAELMNTMHTPTCRMTLTTHKPEEQLATRGLHLGIITLLFKLVFLLDFSLFFFFHFF